MGKHKIFREYGLKSSSANILWSLISTSSGLQQWIADKVTNEGDMFSFTWGDPDGECETRTAQATVSKKKFLIRFQWTDESDGAYWELHIVKSDLTNDYHLEVTDYAEDGEEDYINDIWEQNLYNLHRNTGV